MLTLPVLEWTLRPLSLPFRLQNDRTGVHFEPNVCRNVDRNIMFVKKDTYLGLIYMGQAFVKVISRLLSLLIIIFAYPTPDVGEPWSVDNQESTP